MRIISNRQTGKLTAQDGRLINGEYLYLPVNDQHAVIATPADIILAMQAGHAEAAEFCDTGDTDQPEAGAPWSDDARAASDADVLKFWNENRAVICRAIINAQESSSKYHKTVLQAAEAIGHDLWFTRNGHGVGFWDRPEIWGEGNAKTLTDAAEKLGPASLYAGDAGQIEYARAKK